MRELRVAEEQKNMPANLTAKAIQSTAMKISKISISATAQKRVMIGLTVVGLLTMMAASFYMVLLLLTKPSAKLDATISIIALCATAAIFCFAIVVDFQLTRRRARSAITECIPEYECETNADEIAALHELDELLNTQDPYFRLHLAIALRDKARHFPIRTGEVLRIREVLGGHEQRQAKDPNPQVYHLSKIIAELDSGHAKH